MEIRGKYFSHRLTQMNEIYLFSLANLKAEILDDAIPNANLVELENSSHIFSTDQTEKSVKAILEFLEKVLRIRQQIQSGDKTKIALVFCDKSFVVNERGCRNQTVGD